MTTEQTLALFLDKLEELQVPYMIVGSWASGLHGRARATHDIDVVVRIFPPELRLLLGELGDEFYCPASAVEALETGRMINVIHMETGFKVDLVPVQGRAFSREEFARRMTAGLLGRPRWFATPEDTVLAKLEWGKLGGGQRHFEDAVGVAQVQRSGLNWAYMRRWAQELDVSQELVQLERAL